MHDWGRVCSKSCQTILRYVAYNPYATVMNIGLERHIKPMKLVIKLATNILGWFKVSTSIEVRKWLNIGLHLFGFHLYSRNVAFDVIWINSVYCVTFWHIFPLAFVSVFYWNSTRELALAKNSLKWRMSVDNLRNSNFDLTAQKHPQQQPTQICRLFSFTFHFGTLF